MAYTKISELNELTESPHDDDFLLVSKDDNTSMKLRVSDVITANGMDSDDSKVMINKDLYVDGHTVLTAETHKCYIDQENGNDTNDGLTVNTAYKTFVPVQQKTYRYEVCHVTLLNNFYIEQDYLFNPRTKLSIDGGHYSIVFCLKTYNPADVYSNYYGAYIHFSFKVGSLHLAYANVYYPQGLLLDNQYRYRSVKDSAGNAGPPRVAALNNEGNNTDKTHWGYSHHRGGILMGTTHVNTGPSEIYFGRCLFKHVSEDDLTVTVDPHGEVTWITLDDGTFLKTNKSLMFGNKDSNGSPYGGKSTDILKIKFQDCYVEMDGDAPGGEVITSYDPSRMPVFSSIPTDIMYFHNHGATYGLWRFIAKSTEPGLDNSRIKTDLIIG
jgi:hypothetical protein